MLSGYGARICFFFSAVCGVRKNVSLTYFVSWEYLAIHTPAPEREAYEWERYTHTECVRVPPFFVCAQERLFQFASFLLFRTHTEGRRRPEPRQVFHRCQLALHSQHIMRQATAQCRWHRSRPQWACKLIRWSLTRCRKSWRLIYSIADAFLCRNFCGVTEGDLEGRQLSFPLWCIIQRVSLWISNAYEWFVNNLCFYQGSCRCCCLREGGRGYSPMGERHSRSSPIDGLTVRAT